MKKNILFTLALIFVSACKILTQTEAPKPTISTPIQEFEKKQWMLEEMDGQPTIAKLPNEAMGQIGKPYLEFDFSKKTFNGLASCNNVNGSIESDGSKISFSSITTNAMGCKKELMTQERNFIKNLEQVTRYEIKDQKLSLYAGDKLVLKFIESNVAETKKYSELSEIERQQYISSKLKKLSILNDTNHDKIPIEAINQIKTFVDAYTKRMASKKADKCGFTDNLQSIYERASKNAPMIIEAFKQENVDPQIGLYLATIESEHCECLQSPTGPLGLFQLTKTTGETYGLKVFKDASPTNPDERCDTEKSSSATAKYINSLMQDSPKNKALYAVAFFNSGESKKIKPIEDIWVLISENKKSSKTYNSENLKYVPKFLAAAIIGENPKDFGLEIKPLSTYQK